MTKPNRYFLLNKEIRDNTVEEIIKGILEVNRYDDLHERGRTDYKREPIEIVLETVGGSCYAGFALIGVMVSSKTPVYTYCYGKAFSMGVPLFSAGHKRFAHRLATFMYHQVSSGTHGKVEDMKIDVNESDRLNKLMLNWTLENSNIPKEKLLDTIERKYDWFFTAEEAKEMGLVDELITSKNKRNK